MDSNTKDTIAVKIKLASFDHKLLDIASKQISEAFDSSNVKLIGPIPLPVKKRIYCVLRSPHVNKDAPEHFEMKSYRRIFIMVSKTLEEANSLVKINLPAGVTASLK